MKGPKPPVVVGDVLISNNNGKYSIVEYNHSKDVVVKFEDGTIVNTNCAQIKRGTVRNPNKPSVFGLGYIGQGEYESGTTGKIYKNYNTWSAMLARCYKPSQQESYIGCTVCKEWHNFQNFAKWFEENYVEGWALDKDILISGNRVYSPETCCFVPSEINNNFRRERSDRIKKPSETDFRTKLKILASKYTDKLNPKVYDRLVNFKVF